VEIAENYLECSHNNQIFVCFLKKIMGFSFTLDLVAALDLILLLDFRILHPEVFWRINSLHQLYFRPKDPELLVLFNLASPQRYDVYQTLEKKINMLSIRQLLSSSSLSLYSRVLLFLAFSFLLFRYSRSWSFIS
jgi:hypothetical protein